VASDRLMTSAPNCTASMIPCGLPRSGRCRAADLHGQDPRRRRDPGERGRPHRRGRDDAGHRGAVATQSAPGGCRAWSRRPGPGQGSRGPELRVRVHPLSTTATVTPAPLVRFQTEAKPSSCCAHGAAAGATTPCCAGQPGRGPGRPCGAAWAAGPVSRSAAAQTARVSPHVVPHPPPPPLAFISICTALTPARLTMAVIVYGR